MNSDFRIDEARRYVAQLDLPSFQPAAFGAGDADIAFDQTKQQALAVGSALVSFDTGVEEEFREAISDSALLAQLVANRKVSASSDPIAWFDAYFEVLGNLGWVIQASDVAEYQLKNDGMEVHEAILDVLTAALGSVSPTALALVKQSLASLKAMNEDSPLITLFNRESQHATIGRFQFTSIRQDPDGGLLGEALAFALRADRNITQILFFKLHKNRTTLRRKLGSISLNRAALSGLRQAVRNKVAAYLGSYVAALDLGPPPP